MIKAIDLERIKNLEKSDFTSPETQKEIFNLLESLCKTIIDLSEENQALKNEINRLKGEKGKPFFKPNKDKKPPSKDDLKMNFTPKENWNKSAKNEKIEINRVEIIKLDKIGLPDDIQFKGYEEKIIQNIIVKPDNVLYRMEKYYSPSLGKTYIARIGGGLDGTSFGPETKALISTLRSMNRTVH